jgi:hypothetical protein
MAAGSGSSSFFISLASLENNFQARYPAGVGSPLRGFKGAFVAFEFDTRCNDSPDADFCA